MKRLDRYLATFMQHRKNMNLKLNRQAEDQVTRGAPSGRFTYTQNDWTTIMADFILLNFMYKSRFQIKHLM